MHRSSHNNNNIGEGSDHLQLMNFDRPTPAGRGSAARRKFLAPPYYSQRAVFASLWALFSLALRFPSPSSAAGNQHAHNWMQRHLWNTFNQSSPTTELFALQCMWRLCATACRAWGTNRVLHQKVTHKEFFVARQQVVIAILIYHFCPSVCPSCCGVNECTYRQNVWTFWMVRCISR